MAYADELEGPWTVYTPGALRLEDSYFPTTCPPCALAEGATGTLYAHIAAPDVHVREDLQQIVMYVHGLDAGRQLTRLAVSRDGIYFEGKPEVLGRPYFRVISHDGYYNSLSMPGYLYRSRDGLTGFEPGSQFFNPDMRHNALLVRDNTLYVFWTQSGHAPERIFVSTVDMSGDWMDWNESEPVEILRPETEYEGALLEISPSRRGHIDIPVNQLRDPAIFEENGMVYLLYSVAGESGIALSRIDLVE
jgi:hypothetical protein